MSLKKVIIQGCIVTSAVLLSFSFQPPEKLKPLPEGHGIASRYKMDKGISKDPDVVFHEDFESYKGDKITREEMGDWDNFYNDLVITRDRQNVNSGKQSVQITHVVFPRAIGAVKEVSGYDTLFLRFYLKFHPQFPGTHHAGMYIRGGLPGDLLANPTGTRPQGNDHFCATVDHLFPTHGASPKENNTPPGWIYNYCYHMDQKDIYGDILLPSGSLNGIEGLLGPSFVSRPNKNPELNRWYCYEIMVQCNTPGKRDGRVAIWVDGVLLCDHPNLRFRTVKEVKSRFITLSTYTSRKLDNATMWYDDIVAAKKYIGPINRRAEE